MGIPCGNFKVRKNTSPWKPRKEKIRIRISSKELVEALSNKPEHSEAYLRGLFDAEASVDIKGYIEFKQLANKTGLKLVNEVFDSLKKIGIDVTSVKIKNDRNIKLDAYLYVRDLIRYRKQIGFVDDGKKSKLNIIISAKNTNNKPKISDIKALLAEDTSLWYMINELKSPYHRIRQLLKDNNLAVRQTR